MFCFLADGYSNSFQIHPVIEKHQNADENIEIKQELQENLDFVSPNS